MTFGFIEAKAAGLFDAWRGRADGLGARGLPIAVCANPLSAKFDTLRPSLLPGLVDAVAHNRRHGRRDVPLFEIGTRFAPRRRDARRSHGVDRARLGRALVRRAPRRRFLRRQRRRRASVRRARRAGPVRTGRARLPRRGPGGVIRLRRRAETARVGIAGLVAPGGRRRARAAAAGSGVRRGAESRRCSARARARRRASDAIRCRAIPSVVRDLSIVVVRCLACRDHSWHHSGGRRDRAGAAGRVAFFDRYQGKGVPEGSVSLSVRLTFQARRSHADRRGSPEKRRRDSGGARRGSTARCSDDQHGLIGNGNQNR